MPKTKGATSDPVIPPARVEEFLALPDEKKAEALHRMALDALAIVMGSANREAVVKAAEKALRYRAPTPSESRRRVLAAVQRAKKGDDDGAI